MTVSIIDQLGREVLVPDRPQRIISLCPSETETLAALVVADRIIGCTRYCKYPEELVGSVSKVGGTKQLDLDTIHNLEPDLILAVREENDKAQIEILANAFPVIILDPVNHATTLESVRIMGRAVGETKRAEKTVHKISAILENLVKAQGQRALYLIWRKPYMAAGKGTFIDAMIRSVGLMNAAAGLEGRYPSLDDTHIHKAAPDIILASSEPFPFEEKHRAELEARFPDCPIYFVDGEAFGWHGVRTLHVAETLNKFVKDILA